jgi:hypothetical protein
LFPVIAVNCNLDRRLDSADAEKLKRADLDWAISKRIVISRFDGRKSALICGGKRMPPERRSHLPGRRNITQL